MKNLIYLLSTMLLITSCEDLIDVDLNSAEPKLVIEASINWKKGTSGNFQVIKLSLTAPYFDNDIPPASGAEVMIINSDDIQFKFNEVDATGFYINHDFVPKLNDTYTISISYNGEAYSGTEILKSVVPIERVEQNNQGGFSGEDIELKAYYLDPVDEKDFYFFEFISDIPAIPSLSVYEDRFNNGNEIFGFYSEEALKSEDEVIIRNYGISEQFYNYMFILLQQNSDAGGGPFETQPAIVKGNCINITNPDNYPLGYFRLSELSEVVYIVK